ncbi:MAG: extracellular solute-binding protein [Chloroflexi bacterium]|nr:extracellular solute-binding protein [Chloroflexota bacterium]
MRHSDITSTNRPQHRMAVLFLWVALTLAIGCRALLPSEGPMTPTIKPTPSPSPILTPSPTPMRSPRDQGVTLTVWLPDFTSPVAPGLAGEIVTAQLNAFAVQHPTVDLEYLVKKPYGVGGIQDFLLTAQAVVPEALPDLVAVDWREIFPLAQKGLLQPLDNLISADLLDDLYPFALEAGKIGEYLVALPYECDLTFLAYNATQMPRPPQTWTNVISHAATYLFPAGPGDGAVTEALLIQYFAITDTLTSANGALTPDPSTLTEVFQYYHNLVALGIAPASVLEMVSADDCWPVYEAGKAALTHVRASRIAADRDVPQNTEYAPIPTRAGNTATVAWGWGWAIVTQDPERQKIAAAFIEHMMHPENLSRWCAAAYYLPTRRSSLLQTVADTDYAVFLQRLLEVAYPAPIHPEYPTLSHALQIVLHDVLTGKAAPEEATAMVLKALER